MLQNDIKFVRHMLDATQKALAFVEGYEKTDFESDEMLQLAAIRLIEIIGEASRHVSSRPANNDQRFPGQRLRAPRNQLIHGYFNVDLDIVWSILHDNLPILEQDLIVLLADLSQPQSVGVPS